MLIKNLKTKAAVAILAGGLALSGGLAGAAALSGGSDEDAEAVLDNSDIPEFPSSTDGGVVLDGDIALNDDAASAPDLPETADDEAGTAKEGNHEGRAQAPDQAKPADNHGAEVSAVAQADTPTDAKNHGAAVCEVASGGRCMPDKDRGGRPADPGPAAAKSFEAQIERCDAKGDEKAAMFREDHKREQANHTHDQEEACEQKFEAKQAPADDDPAAEDADHGTAAEDHATGKSAEHRQGGADR